MVATKTLYGLASYSDGVYTDSPVTKLKRLSNGASFPGVMASPPTVAAASTSSTVTGSLVSSVSGTSPNISNFRFIQSNFVQAGAGYPNDGFVIGRNITDGMLSDIHAEHVGVEFMTDAPIFELHLFGGATYRVLIDGAYVSLTPTTLANDGNLYFVKHTFATRIPRRIRIEANGVTKFGGVKVTALDSVWTPALATPFRIICVGDSYLENYRGLPSYIGGFLGVEDCWGSGLGGTGYVTTNNGRVALINRLASDVTAYAPDMVITMAGINDAANAGLQTAVAAYHAALRTALPNVLSVTTGPWSPRGVADDRLPYISAGVAAGDAQTLFIDNVTPRWQSATSGNVSSTAGLGNGDVYLQSDNTHPVSTAGVEYLARRLTDEIKRTIAALA